MIGSWQTSITAQGGHSPVSDLEKLAREAQQSALEKEHKIGDLTIAGLIKERALVQTE